MKVPIKWELQQIVFNRSCDIDFQDFMNLYKKRTAKAYSFLVIDTTLSSNNTFRTENNLLERIWKLIIATDDKIRREKLQHDIKRESHRRYYPKKLWKYNFFTGEEILTSSESQMIELAKFIYPSLGKAL